MRHRLTFLALSALTAACGTLSSSDETPTAAPLRPTAPTAGAAAATTPEPTSTPPIDYVDFCSQAEFTSVDWNLPDVLTDSLQDGTITLRYRLPPGAEALLVWMGVPIDPESVTVGELIAANPALADAFPNADGRARIPSNAPTDGFDLEADGQTHLVQVHILLPTEQGYDNANAWR